MAGSRSCGNVPDVISDGYVSLSARIPVMFGLHQTRWIPVNRRSNFVQDETASSPLILWICRPGAVSSGRREPCRQAMMGSAVRFTGRSIAKYSEQC